MEVNFTMLKRFFVSLFMCFISYGVTYAQVQITGTVLDDQEEPLPGVTVYLKGTSVGAITAVDGTYSLTIPTSVSGEVIAFSFVGFKTLEVPVNNRTVINVQLEADQQMLKEVVVGALGIEREAYTLGYSVQKVDAEDITEVRSGNWVNSLKGQVAGLNLQSGGTGPASTTRITLRGESGLNFANNEALIVVDGIPVQSRTTGNGANSYLGSDSPVDYGDGVGDINPDDIESVTVLKGPGAAALYGSRAANGAIIITTKSSKVKKGIGVSYSTGLTLDKITIWPDYQMEYGSGSRTRLNPDYYSFGTTEDGKNTQSTHTWGPKFEGQQFYQYYPEGERSTWQAQDFIKGYFETGKTVRHNLAVSGAGEMGNVRLSVTNLKNDWIVPNTGYETSNIALKSSLNLNQYMTLNTSANYIKRGSDNLPTAGYGSHSPMYYFMWTNNSVNINWMKDYWEEEDVKQKNGINRNADNPYFQAYEQIDANDKNRLIGMISLDIKPTEDISLMLRTGMDQSSDFRRTIRPKSSVKFPQGMYREQTVDFQEINSDFLASYTPKIADLETKISIGGNYRNEQARNYRITAEQLVLPGVYNLGNAVTRPLVNNARSERQMYSLYGILNLGSKWWNLDLTARNDWSSTLAQGNNSYFYPSANLSLLMSELMDMGTAVDMVKLRFSASQVGNDTRPYSISKYYSYSSFDASLSNPGTIPTNNLKPEQVTSYETGFDIRLFRGRLNFDATLYHAESRNQIINVPIDPASGYTRFLMNAGQINNTGVEVSAGFVPVKINDFEWRTRVNWAANRGKVIALTEGVDSYIMASGIANRVTVEARPGERVGDIYGRGYLRAPSGEIIFKNGMPQLTTEIMKVGNAFPDWTGGVFNNFSYKGLKLGVLFDFRKGGDMYSLTYAALSYSGKLTNSLAGRYDRDVIGEGVVDNGDGTYSPNTQQPNNIGYYYDALYSRDNIEKNTLDGSFVKLRELSLGYDLPASLLEKTFIKNATVSVAGRNLVTWSDWPVFDPEAATMDGNTINPGLETGQFPSTTSYSFNIQLSF